MRQYQQRSKEASAWRGVSNVSTVPRGLGVWRSECQRIAVARWRFGQNQRCFPGGRSASAAAADLQSRSPDADAGPRAADTDTTPDLDSDAAAAYVNSNDGSTCANRNLSASDRYADTKMQGWHAS